jgi:hypothetical protein
MGLFDLMLLLVYLVLQPFNFRLMKVPQFIFVFFMLPDQVVLDVFKLCSYQMKFMRFLLFHLLQLVAAVVSLY